MTLILAQKKIFSASFNGILKDVCFFLEAVAINVSIVVSNIRAVSEVTMVSFCVCNHKLLKY